jgi:hypothetical protein
MHVVICSYAVRIAYLNIHDLVIISIWWRKQILKLLVLHFSSAFFYFLTLEPSCSPEHPVHMYSPRIRHQFWHPQKKTAKMIDLYVIYRDN